MENKEANVIPLHESWMGSSGIRYDVQALRKYAELLPIETRPVAMFNELTKEGATSWGREEGEGLGVYDIISN